jgi:hypothetical protein
MSILICEVILMKQEKKDASLFFFFDASLFTLLYFPSDGQTPQ